MAFTVFTASGYLSGDGVTNTTPTKITGILVIPGTADGSFKIEEGINGADKDLIPENDATVLVKQDLTPFYIPIKAPRVSSNQVYVTLAGAGLQLMIEHEKG